MKGRTNQEEQARVIRTPDQRLRVFISSTLRELEEEREAARQAVSRLGLTPVLFETGARPHPPRELYRAYLAQSHVFIGIYWNRYGWVAPEMDISGLEDEYRLAGEMPRLIYLKKPAHDREEGLSDLIREIKESAHLSYHYFETAGELADFIVDDLALLLSERFEHTRHIKGDGQTGADLQARKKHAVPRPLTSLIGRRREAEAITRLMMQPDIQLVSLIGPGGVGKTRLCLHVATGLEDDFEQGVFWVNLESIRHPELVISTIAQVLDVREYGGQSLMESLQAYLRDKRLLLVLDNFEQVLGAAPLIANLLSMAPGLKVLVTSRAALRLRGEREFPVPPLELPEISGWNGEQKLLENDSVRLFIDRARAIRPGLLLDDDSWMEVAKIVRRLDGLPLAIELAAARMNILSTGQLLERLDDRLKILTGGSQDLPHRQQTMRSVIDWSCDLLDEPVRDLFACLSVFVGGFSLEAAEAVCEQDDELSVLDGIADLIGNSLLRQEFDPADHPRYLMLDVLREYAADHLDRSGQSDLYRQRHASYFAGLAERTYPELFSADSEARLDRLQVEYGNFREAILWCQRLPENHRQGWHIIRDLIWFWYRRGFLNEARQWYDWAIEAAASVGDNLVRGLLLDNAGFIAMWQSDLFTAARLMDAGLAIIRKSSTIEELAQALFGRGVLAVNQGQSEVAQANLEEALVLYDRQGQKWFRSIILLHLGNVSFDRGDLSGARSFYQESLSLGKSLGDRWLIASTINNFGELARYAGDANEARERYLESRQLFAEIDSSPDLARADHSLGWAALALSNHQEAWDLFRNAMDRHQKLGVQRGTVEVLAGIGAWKADHGEALDAIRLLSAAGHLFEALGAGVWPADKADIHRRLKALMTELGEDAYRDAWDEGQEMDLHDALSLAQVVSHED